MIRSGISARRALVLALATSLTLAGCSDDSSSTAGGGGGGGGEGTPCTGGATAFFGTYDGTYTLPADFRGVGFSYGAEDLPPTTPDQFTEGNDYDIVIGDDGTVTFPTDSGDMTFDFSDSDNVRALCEAGVTDDGRTYEEYVRIDTATHSILFQVQEGEDEELGTADDRYTASFTILNDESGDIISNYDDDEFWSFGGDDATEGTEGEAELTASGSTPASGDGDLEETGVSSEIDGTLTRVAVTGDDFKVKVYYTTETGVVTNVSYLWGNLETDPADFADNIVSCSGTCGATVDTTAGTITLVGTSLESLDETQSATLDGTITLPVAALPD